MNTVKKAIRILLLLGGIPLLILLGATAWNDRRYQLVTMGIAVLSVIPFFLTFERREANTRKLVLVAVLTAISVAGRFIFGPVPFFKPVTAVTILTAIYFGPEAGFLTGSFSAVVSNMFFGQGPWTPFQMFSWGMIGFLAGVLNHRGWMKQRPMLLTYGVLSGIMYSFVMDVWTVLNYDGSFGTAGYLAALASAVPVTAVYCVSNVVFLLALEKPVGERLMRMKKKYGI